MKNFNITKTKKIYIGVSAFAIMLTIIIGIMTFQSKPSKIDERKADNTVSVSFYPLYYFAQQVGGDSVNVVNITPAGSEPHEYEPTSKQIQDLYTSKLVIFNGAGLDPWATKIQKDLENAKIKTLDMSGNFTILTPLESANISENEEEKEEQDPHIWLSPKMAIKQVEIIRDALIKIDEKNKNIYEENSKKTVAKLTQLDTEYKNRLTNCSKNEIITSHNFLQYLAKEYGFTSTPISGISPESEPSSKDLANIAQLVRQKGIKYIFTETLASPKLAETIAKETGAQTLVLNPLEGLTDDEIKEGKDYVSVQKDNLANLTKALECR